jgi:hypothetical protein
MPDFSPFFFFARSFSCFLHHVGIGLGFIYMKEKEENDIS